MELQPCSAWTVGSLKTERYVSKLATLLLHASSQNGCLKESFFQTKVDDQFNQKTITLYFIYI